ncbi:MAG: DJ-1/PfpI family protein [Defluviitaleaceae bacterium]|nr:DJ-1/PfpI family protein [Defluviitaleaceae bacterium]
MHEAYVFLTDGFEEIEAITALDILRRGGVSVMSVSLTGKRDVTGSHGICVRANIIFDDIVATEGAMLILPGGPGTANYKKHELLLELLRLHNATGGKIAAICAAPTVLGMLGFLADKVAVCYPALKDSLKAAEFGQRAVVTDGNITTSKGPATSAEFAFEILRIIKGDREVAKVAEGMLAESVEK